MRFCVDSPPELKYIKWATSTIYGITLTLAVVAEFALQIRGSYTFEFILTLTRQHFIYYLGISFHWKSCELLNNPFLLMILGESVWKHVICTMYWNIVNANYYSNLIDYLEIAQNSIALWNFNESRGTWKFIVCWSRRRRRRYLSNSNSSAGHILLFAVFTSPHWRNYFRVFWVSPRIKLFRQLPAAFAQSRL